jgi:hypothetical protein
VTAASPGEKTCGSRQAQSSAALASNNQNAARLILPIDIT